MGNIKKKNCILCWETLLFPKKTAVLRVPVTLNFIIPYEEHLKIKAVIKNKLPILSDVKIEYHYQNVELLREDIIRLAIPHIIEEINGRFATITKTIRAEEYCCDGEKLKIMALGETAVNKLNDEVAPLFEKAFETHFGLTLSVFFQNHDDSYIKACKERERKAEAEVLRLEKEAEAAREAFLKADRMEGLRVQVKTGIKVLLVCAAAREEIRAEATACRTAFADARSMNR